MVFAPHSGPFTIEAQVFKGQLRFEKHAEAFRYWSSSEKQLPLTILRGYYEDGIELVDTRWWSLEPITHKGNASLVKLTFLGEDFTRHYEKLEKEHADGCQASRTAPVSPELKAARRLYMALLNAEPIQFYVVEGDQKGAGKHREVDELVRPLADDQRRGDTEYECIAALIVRLNYRVPARRAERHAALDRDHDGKPSDIRELLDRRDGDHPPRKRREG